MAHLVVDVGGIGLDVVVVVIFDVIGVRPGSGKCIASLSLPRNATNSGRAVTGSKRTVTTCQRPNAHVARKVTRLFCTDHKLEVGEAGKRAGRRSKQTCGTALTHVHFVTGRTLRLHLIN